MKLPVYELKINESLSDDSEVTYVALVDEPAIQKDFLAFKDEFVDPRSGESEDEFIGRCVKVLIDEGTEQEQALAICYSKWEKKFAADSYTDYPEAAVENAKTALRWAEENGWGDCGESTGKLRANQLANKKPISRDTIARMAAFERHRQNSDRPLGEGCGRLMWLAWGGDAGIAWAQRKLKQIDKEKLTSNYFGGEGSGCNGPNCGRPSGNSSDTNITSNIKNVINEIENGNAPSVSELIKIDKENPKAAAIIEDISYNQSGSYKELDNDGKKIFDKLTTAKDYELYRVDSRYNIDNIKNGDTLDFEKSPTFVASNINYVKNLSSSRGDQSPSIIVFEKGTHSIRHRKNFDDGSHELIRGTYKVKKIEDNKIYVSGLDKFVNNFVIQDEDKRIISGPLMLADELIYRSNNKFGEHYVKFTAETIKAIAIKFAKKKYQANVNLMHDPDQKVQDVTMFESWIVDKERGILPMKGFEDVANGSWFGSFYVENDDVWKKVKDGEYRGFSVEGLFDYEKPKSYEEQMLEKIKNLLYS